MSALPQDYAILVWWSREDDQYIARCLEVPPCVGVGETPGEAIMSAYSAVEAHLDYREELDLDPPQTTTADQRHGRRTLHRLGSLELIRAQRFKTTHAKPELRVLTGDDDSFDYEAMLQEELQRLVNKHGEEG